MATIRNFSIFRNIQRIFGFKSSDRISSQVGNIVVPVVLIKDVVNVSRGVTITATGTATVFSVPSDRDFYLTSVGVGQIKDATHDGATGGIQINGFVAGVVRPLISLPTLITTAQDNNAVKHFDPPILIDRGTNIVTGGTGTAFTVGTQSTTASISGYTSETEARNTGA